MPWDPAGPVATHADQPWMLPAKLTITCSNKSYLMQGSRLPQGTSTCTLQQQESSLRLPPSRGYKLDGNDDDVNDDDVNDDDGRECAMPRSEWTAGWIPPYSFIVHHHARQIKFLSSASPTVWEVLQS